MFAALNDEGETGLTINDSMPEGFLAASDEHMPKDKANDHVVEVTINDSIDSETAAQCQAVADARITARAPFGGNMGVMLNNHLTLLQDVQTLSSLATPSEDTIVIDSYAGEKEKIGCLNDDSEGSPCSEEAVAHAPEPNTHYYSDGGNVSDSRRGEESVRRSQSACYGHAKLFSLELGGGFKCLNVQ